MTQPLWLDADRGPTRDPLTEDLRCEVCVVGGGISGVLQALLLAERGIDTVLLEKDRIASRASGRNTGFQITGLGEHYVNTAHSLGRDGARTVWQTNRDSHDLVRDLADRYDVDAEIERTGSWVLAFDDDEWDELRRSHEMLRDDGFEAELVHAEDVPGVLGAEFPGALHQPYDGQLNPVRLLDGLAEAADDAGARLFEHSPAVGIEPTGSGMRALASQATVESDVVVLATNAHTPLLWPEASEWLLPARGQVLATAPLPDNPLPGPVYADHGWVYFRPYRGRLLCGGFRKYAFETEIGYDEITTGAVQDHIEGFLAETWPDLDLEVTHRWGGIMANSADGLPIVGPLSGRPELLVNVGHTGHGLAYAPQAADWIAEMLQTGRNRVPSIFSARRTLDIHTQTPV